MEKILIEELKEQELDIFYDLFKKCTQNLFPGYSERTREYLHSHERTYNKEVIRRKIKNGDTLLIAKSDGNIVGYLIADKQFGGVSFCHWLVVDPGVQKKGIGKMLLVHWEQMAKVNGAHSLRLESDKRNLEYYKNRGYAAIGLDEKGYFGSDNYILKKSIQEPKEENWFK